MKIVPLSVPSGLVTTTLGARIGEIILVDFDCAFASTTWSDVVEAKSEVKMKARESLIMQMDVQRELANFQSFILYF